VIVDEPVMRHEPGQVPSPAWLAAGTPRYSAQDRWIVGRGLPCLNNRPLYCHPDSDGVALAGDRPLVRLLARPVQCGAFAAAILRAGSGRWFHEWHSVESRYRCGRMTWVLSDPSLAGTLVTVECVPLPDAAGFALRLAAEGIRRGDQLAWCFGGAAEEEDVRLRWDPVMRGNPDICKTGDPRKPELSMGIMPSWCRGNVVEPGPTSVLVAARPGAPRPVRLRVSRDCRFSAADAAASALPSDLCASTAADLPMACGLVELAPGTDEVFVAAVAAPASSAPASSAPAAAAASPAGQGDPRRAFLDACHALRGQEQVTVTTPEPRLDAAVAAVCHAVDAGCKRDPVEMQHGCMAFFIPFVGWRVIGGSTALGWHDRVRANVSRYIAAQAADDPLRTRPQANAERRLCLEGPDSMLYGKGRITTSPFMYDTQSQLFDQAVRDWRWTADPGLERVLRPALDVQLGWARACFDPDDDGLYESYINTLPTDTVWYNGGGSVEESAYAFYGHRAAADMARRAGDAAAARRHAEQADTIRRAVTEVLWLEETGHFGLYKEQGGHGRVHPDAWVYSEFLPIDLGMTEPAQALQALYWTEWALERIPLPFGGELCQPSNWVPSKWSVRDMFNGDAWHLALAYFRTGLAEDGWSLLLGSLLETGYAGAVPGGFTHIGAGTDFADCTNMFARVVVEGLFGWDPDLPNGVVHVRPAFPSAWPSAAISTPDFSLRFESRDGVDAWHVQVTRAADMDLRLPARAERISAVTVAGRAAAWTSEPGHGCSIVRVTVPAATEAHVEIRREGRVAPHAPATRVTADRGTQVELRAPRGRVTAVRDLHGILDGTRVDGSTIRARVAGRPGHHLVVAEVTVGELTQLHVFKITVSDPAAERAAVLRTPRRALPGSAWSCIDMEAELAADVTQIFRQRYLSPRPATCSVRLGEDGYSAWTFAYWGDQPPVIDLSHLPELSGGTGLVTTPQGVPFRVSGSDRNIGFTSLWDNWPRSVTVPVGRRARTAWTLVCGSTFPMQLRIPNARLRFRYAGGDEESLDLVPPLNFWCLCPWGGRDYSYETDAFCLPAEPPPMVELGAACRAMVLSWTLRPDAVLESVTLEALSQEVVIGLMAVTLDTSAD
jgi:hypothetical protein